MERTTRDQCSPNQAKREWSHWSGLGVGLNLGSGSALGLGSGSGSGLGLGVRLGFTWSISRRL
eukprot:scaffold125067_cov27-Phaeocystis_antarctica.AAC.1